MGVYNLVTAEPSSRTEDLARYTVTLLSAIQTRFTASSGRVSIAYIVPAVEVVSDIGSRANELPPRAVQKAGKKSNFDKQLKINWDTTERQGSYQHSRHRGSSWRRNRP